MEEGMVVDWKAEIFAGVYAGYEISEMKTARINVVLYSFPTPLPKDQYVYTEKEFVLCYFFFPQRVDLKLLILDNTVLSAFLMETNQHSEVPQWHESLVYKDTGWQRVYSEFTLTFTLGFHTMESIKIF